MKTKSLPPGKISRRAFLRTTAFCGTALALSSDLTANTKITTESKNPATGYQFLTGADIPFMRAVFLAVAEPALSESTNGRTRAITSALERFDYQCHHLSPAMQLMLRKLLMVANTPVIQGVITGIWEEWERVGWKESIQFMDYWQSSRLFPLRMGHAALTQLTVMAWYSTEEAVIDTGYRGVPHSGLLVTQPNNY